LEQAFDIVKKQLLGRMHDIVRQQLQLPSTEGDNAGAMQQQQQQQQRLLGPAAAHMEIRGGSSGSGEQVQVEVLAPEQQSRGG